MDLTALPSATILSCHEVPWSHGCTPSGYHARCRSQRPRQAIRSGLPTLLSASWRFLTEELSNACLRQGAYQWVCADDDDAETATYTELFWSPVAQSSFIVSSQSPLERVGVEASSSLDDLKHRITTAISWVHRDMLHHVWEEFP